MTSPLAATPGTPGGVAVCLPNVLGSFLIFFVDDFSCVRRRLSPRYRAIIMELNESVFALNFLETGGLGLSEPCEKVEYSTLSTDLASPALHRLHSVISDFRPLSVTESGERQLFGDCLPSHTIGGYSMTSDDPDPGSLTAFQSSRAARPQDASKARNIVSLLRSSAHLTGTGRSTR